VAKRKLSDRQRIAIRKEIKAMLASRVPRHEVVKALSAKYRISPISLRWHIRMLLGAGRGSGIQSAPFTRILNQLSDKKVKRILAAKKLVPELESARRHESELRGKIRDLERQLHAEENKVRLIKQRIKRLSGF
jgi:hypothetical protein